MLDLSKFEVQVHGKFGVTPVKKEDGSVGFDIAMPKDAGNLVLPPNTRRRVDTGVIIKPPRSCFVVVVPRSSSSTKSIRFSNTIGVIDPSYCGQDDTIKIDMSREDLKHDYHGQYDTSGETLQGYCNKHGLDLKSVVNSYVGESRVMHVFTPPVEDGYIAYKAGERFCQILFLPFYSPTLVESPLSAFSENNRGGYGSTGQAG